MKGFVSVGLGILDHDPFFNGWPLRHEGSIENAWNDLTGHLRTIQMEIHVGPDGFGPSNRRKTLLVLVHKIRELLRNPDRRLP